MEEINALTVSVFKDTYNSETQNDVSLIKVFEIIQSETLHQRITDVRAGKENKKLLPCFTPCGIIMNKRKLDINLFNYTGIICLDLDHLEAIEQLKENLKINKYVFAFFVSPSGKGLKVFIRVTSKIFHHSTAWEQLRDYFKRITGLDVDTKCRNISRLCYFSYDPDLYINKDAKEFPVDENFTPVVLMPEIDRIYKKDNAVEFLISLTNNKQTYISGNRNEYLFLLACNCNRYGLAIEDTESICQHVWQADSKELPWSEIKATIKSAYRSIHEHGTRQLHA